MVDWIERLLPPEEDEEEEDVLLREAGGVLPPPEDEAGEDGAAAGEDRAPEAGKDGPAAAEAAAEQGRDPGGAEEKFWERAIDGQTAERPARRTVQDGEAAAAAPPRRQGQGEGLGPGRARTAAEGLEALYRQTARAAQAAAPALEARPVERMVHVRETEGGAALTAEELDRAVRRDSRRYDGGMSIF